MQKTMKYFNYIKINTQYKKKIKINFAGKN